MSNFSTTINGVEYPLATTLRVAYMVQGQHNHKPYAEVFRNVGDMCVEDQIGIIYCAFKCANPEVALTMPLKDFTEYYLDNMNLKNLLDQLQSLVRGIMGEDGEEETPAATTTESSGN